MLFDSPSGLGKISVVGVSMTLHLRHLPRSDDLSIFPFRFRGAADGGQGFRHGSWILSSSPRCDGSRIRMSGFEHPCVNSSAVVFAALTRTEYGLFPAITAFKIRLAAIGSCHHVVSRTRMGLEMQRSCQASKSL